MLDRKVAGKIMLNIEALNVPAKDEKLYLSGQDIGDSYVEDMLKTNQNIKILDISKTLVPSLDFLYGLTLSELEEVDISSTLITDLSPLTELKNIKTLYANHLNLSSSALDSISELTKLESLSIEYNKINNVDVLRNLKNLKSLSLFGNKDIIDISPIGELDKLEELYLEGTGINSSRQLYPILHMRFERILVNHTVKSQADLLLKVPSESNLNNSSVNYVKF